MPSPLGKKGFFVSTPLVGAVLFLTAALIAVTISVENDAKIGVARSAQANDKLEFMSQAIQADSYDVLLQQNLERLTTEFMQGYFNINAEETWRQSLRSNIVEYFSKALGPTLGLDIRAYAQAYSNIPGVEECKVEQAEGGLSRADVYDSPAEGAESDGTMVARGYSYGQSISCRSFDPEGNLKVDIGGRYYRINVRVPKLYDLAKSVISTAKAALNGNIAGIAEPIASWTADKWAIVTKADNKLVYPTVRLDEIVDAWSRLMDTWFASMVTDIMNDEIRENNMGISLSEFAVKQEKEEAYKLTEDFEVSCDAENKAGIYRNCMPFRLSVVLGDTQCAGMEPPENAQNPFYNLKSLSMTCGMGNCQGALRDAMKSILAPFGSVCVSYYEYEDSVYPVCKKWKAKAKSVLIKGALTDDNPEYVLTGQDNSVFRFKDQQPDVAVTSLQATRLKCEFDAADPNGDNDRYRDNVRMLLQNLEVSIGVSDAGPNSVKRWMDTGSSLTPVSDDTLRGIYENIYGHGVMPTPCFKESDFGPYTSAKAGPKCYDQNVPRVDMRIDWDDVRVLCESRINNLCNAYCGGVALDTNAAEFCESMFPPEGVVGGGSGMLRCKGAPACGDTLVKITSMSFGRPVMG